jgi:hypothetical protein
VWADGSDEPVINRSNINTVQRAQGPDGRCYTQRWMSLMEGDYTSGLPVPATTRLVLTRIGKTLAEADADRPTSAGTNLADQYYSGRGPSYGAPLVKRIESRTPAQSLLPPSLEEDATQP